MPKKNSLNAAMVIPTAIVAGLIGYTLVKFSNCAFVGVTIFFMLPALLPLLMGHLLLFRMHEPKAQFMIVLAHLVYFISLGVVWVSAVWPFGQGAGHYHLFFPFFVVPFCVACWGTACFLNRSKSKKTVGRKDRDMTHL